MNLATYLEQLKSAASTPPRMPKIRASNPRGRRTRQTEESLQRAQQNALAEVEAQARRQVQP